MVSNAVHAGGKEDDDTNWPYGTGKTFERDLASKNYHTPEAGPLISRGFREVVPLASSVGDPQGRDIAAKNILKDCRCETCKPNSIDHLRFIVCSKCGNKRCPHATNHIYECTNSNEPGQKGSSWEHFPSSSKTDKIKSDGWSSAYYELPEGAVEIQDLVEYKRMNFAVGNIFKACYRLYQKEGNDDAYDLNKIIWYAKRELNRIAKEKQNGK